MIMPWVIQKRASMTMKTRHIWINIEIWPYRMKTGEPIPAWWILNSIWKKANAIMAREIPSCRKSRISRESMTCGRVNGSKWCMSCANIAACVRNPIERMKFAPEPSTQSRRLFGMSILLLLHQSKAACAAFGSKYIMYNTCMWQHLFGPESGENNLWHQYRNYVLSKAENIYEN